MSADLIVYGASDDLIETVGLIEEEFSPSYDKPALLTVLVDDAVFTRLHIEFDPDDSGEWRIQPTNLGALVQIIEARHTDDGTWDDDGCPGYSDKAVIDMLGIEARRVTLRLAEAAS